MPIGVLKARIARLPEQPGVYLYFNGAGETLYVGKASVLRDRVRSYLSALHDAAKVVDNRKKVLQTNQAQPLPTS